MRIAVFTKYVPDAAEERTFTADKTVDRDTDGLLSELDEYPLEEALTIAEAHGKDAEVIAITVGPKQAVAAVKKSLQIGAKRGVHVLDDRIAGSCVLSTSRVLAAVVEKLHAEAPLDLVLTGLASTDGVTSAVPVQVAERLGWPAATVASSVEVADGKVRIRRDGDTSSQFIEAELPAVVSVTDQINEPRYPSFRGIMAAKRKPLDTWTLDDLGVSGDEVGQAAASTVVQSITERPPRTAGEIVHDEGDGGRRLAEYLAAQKLV